MSTVLLWIARALLLALVIYLVIWAVTDKGYVPGPCDWDAGNGWECIEP